MWCWIEGCVLGLDAIQEAPSIVILYALDHPRLHWADVIHVNTAGK